MRPAEQLVCYFTFKLMQDSNGVAGLHGSLQYCCGCGEQLQAQVHLPSGSSRWLPHQPEHTSCNRMVRSACASTTGERVSLLQSRCET